MDWRSLKAKLFFATWVEGQTYQTCHPLHHQCIITSCLMPIWCKLYVPLPCRHGLEGKTQEEQVWIPSPPKIWGSNIIESERFAITLFIHPSAWEGEDRLAVRQLDRLRTSPHWSLLQVAENYDKCDENIYTLTKKILWAAGHPLKMTFSLKRSLVQNQNKTVL